MLLHPGDFCAKVCAMTLLLCFAIAVALYTPCQLLPGDPGKTVGSGVLEEYRFLILRACGLRHVPDQPLPEPF